MNLVVTLKDAIIAVLGDKVLRMKIFANCLCYYMDFESKSLLLEAINKHELVSNNAAVK